MNPERWQQIEEILQTAIDRPRAERAVFVEKACAGDDELIRETTSLIDAFDDAGDFMEEPAFVKDARVLAEASSNASLGRNIGHYEIVELLGAGGMGDVYLAEDARLGRLVALKILPPSFVFDRNRLTRFQREARAASGLNHPNIFTIHEVGEVDGVHFIATEFVDGQTLSDATANRVLSIAEILGIAVQIGSALSAAHEAGIVHRDIKPENIMLRRDGIVKILDFGIAKLNEPTLSENPSEASTLIKSQTETGVVMGTPGYMSPEQSRGAAVDEGTDIWSFGVVLYEVATHQSPFASETRADTLVAILEHEPQPLSQYVSEITPELLRLQEIIYKSIQKKREERYQSVAEMLADLSSLKKEVDLAAMLNERQSTDATDSQAVSRKQLRTSTSARNANSTRSTVGTSTHKTRFFGRQHSLVAFILGLLLVITLGVIIYRHYVPVRVDSSRETNVGADVVVIKNRYMSMNEVQQLAFIEAQEQRISAMMGDRPAKLNHEALNAIKERIDRYVARLGSISDEPGKEDLRVIYARAIPFIPLITRSFTARKVPVIIGIYLPMIESEYKLCFESSSGAKGLFQFLPRTAIAYGVPAEEMCNVDKMTPAAAHYLADRMAELGDDSQSMTLVLLSYNFGADGVRDALRELRETENFERNFWTLLKNREKFDKRFRDEGAHYVPSFFAAAIIGENPGAFDLQTPPLSTLTINMQASRRIGREKGRPETAALTVGAPTHCQCG